MSEWQCHPDTGCFSRPKTFDKTIIAVSYQDDIFINVTWILSGILLAVVNLFLPIRRKLCKNYLLNSPSLEIVLDVYSMIQGLFGVLVAVIGIYGPRETSSNGSVCISVGFMLLFSHVSGHLIFILLQLITYNTLSSPNNTKNFSHLPLLHSIKHVAVVILILFVGAVGISGMKFSHFFINHFSEYSKKSLIAACYPLNFGTASSDKLYILSLFFGSVTAASMFFANFCGAQWWCSGAVRHMYQNSQTEASHISFQRRLMIMTMLTVASDASVTISTFLVNSFQFSVPVALICCYIVSPALLVFVPIVHTWSRKECWEKFRKDYQSRHVT